VKLSNILPEYSDSVATNIHTHKGRERYERLLHAGNYPKSARRKWLWALTKRTGRELKNSPVTKKRHYSYTRITCLMISFVNLLNHT
jgi:hypothetical protein